MPLLTIAMADVPAADAGLGSGIINVSQQVAGALGLAVLGTIATNHSKALAGRGPRARQLARRRLPPRLRDRRGEHRGRDRDRARRPANPRRCLWPRTPRRTQSRPAMSRPARATDRTPSRVVTADFWAAPRLSHMGEEGTQMDL